MIKSIPLIFLAVLLLTINTSSQESKYTLRELIKQLGDNDIGLRTISSRKIIESWSLWSEDDIKELAKAAEESADSEISTRIAVVFREINERRFLTKSIGSEIITKIPEITSVLKNGTAEQKRDVIFKIKKMAVKGELESYSQFLLLMLKDKGSIVTEVITPWRDKTEYIRNHALQALVELKPKESVKHLLEFINSGGDQLAIGAAVEAYLKVSATESGDDLLKFLDHKDPNVKCSVLYCMATLSIKQKDLDKSVLLLNDDNKDVRRAAIYLLDMSARKLPEAVKKEYIKEVSKLLTDKEYNVRSSAIMALSNCGASEYSNNLVQRILLDDEVQIAGLAASAIQEFLRLGLKCGDAIQELSAKFKDKDEKIRYRAIVAFKFIKAKEVGKEIIKLLDNETSTIRFHAIGALINAEAFEFKSEMKEFLNDPEEIVRDEALRYINAADKKEPDRKK